MATTTGTATDYADLLDKLRAYLLANGWTILNYAAGTVAGGGAVLNVRGPGAGAGKEVFINVRTEANSSLSQYGWRIRGAVGYTSGLTEGTQPGEQGNASHFNLWQNSIDYWFWVNDRRFIVVAKMSTVYASMYAGFILPFALPASYPFPLYIGGSYGSLDVYNVSNAANRFFVDPGGSIAAPAASMRKPDGSWLPIYNADYSNAVDDGVQYGRAAVGFVWPYSVGETDYYGNYQYPGNGGNGSSGVSLFDGMVATRQGEYGMFPVSIHAATESPFGVLDGVFAIGGTGLVTEQAVATGGRNFKLFQNLFRNSGNDFMAIESL